MKLPLMDLDLTTLTVSKDHLTEINIPKLPFTIPSFKNILSEEVGVRFKRGNNQFALFNLHFLLKETMDFQYGQRKSLLKQKLQKGDYLPTIKQKIQILSPTDLRTNVKDLENGKIFVTGKHTIIKSSTPKRISDWHFSAPMAEYKYLPQFLFMRLETADSLFNLGYNFDSKKEEKPRIQEVKGDVMRDESSFSLEEALFSPSFIQPTEKLSALTSKNLFGKLNSILKQGNFYGMNLTLDSFGSYTLIDIDECSKVIPEIKILNEPLSNGSNYVMDSTGMKLKKLYAGAFLEDLEYFSQIPVLIYKNGEMNRPLLVIPSRK
jgi:hypothetical protein